MGRGTAPQSGAVEGHRPLHPSLSQTRAPRPRRLFSNPNPNKASAAARSLAPCVTLSYNTNMKPRANRPISVTLGPLAEAAERRVLEGRYASISEVVRDGLRALDREERMFDEILKRKVEAALADSRPKVAPQKLREEMKQWHLDRRKSEG